MGHYLTALSLVVMSTGNATLRSRLDYYVDELARVQEVLSEDGYLSAFPSGQGLCGWESVGRPGGLTQVLTATRCAPALSAWLWGQQLATRAGAADTVASGCAGAEFGQHRVWGKGLGCSGWLLQPSLCYLHTEQIRLGTRLANPAYYVKWGPFARLWHPTDFKMVYLPTLPAFLSSQTCWHLPLFGRPISLCLHHPVCPMALRRTRAEHIDRVEALQPVWAPYYVIHKIMAGLLDAHLLVGNHRALEVVVKMANYHLKRSDKVVEEKGADYWQRTLATEFGGGFGSLLGACGKRVCVGHRLSSEHAWIAECVFLCVGEVKKEGGPSLSAVWRRVSVAAAAPMPGEALWWRLVGGP